MRESLLFRVFLAQLALGAACLAGCSGNPDSTAPAGTAAASVAGRAASAPAVSITTVPALKQDFTVVLQAIGTAAPISSVDVKPQVTSVVTRVHVVEGQFVRSGDLLFTLDSRSDEANVAKMRAQVAKDEAALADARRQLARSKELLAQNFVSQGAVDANQTTVESQLASVEGDRAALNAALVSLSYATVTAPSTGRVGAITVYPGTAVQANQTTLVTITQLDPIDVSFSLPQRYLGNLLAALKAANASVTARIPDSGVELTGRLQFVDNAIDAGTGTVKVKARFENAATRLWPGAFVNVSMDAGTLKDAVVIPLGTIIQSARGPIVYVVDKDRAVLRPVNILESRGEDAAVTGVRGGELVVLDGRQNLRPDSAVFERAREGGGKPVAPGASGAREGGGKPAAPGASGAAAKAANPQGAGSLTRSAKPLPS
ncbi:MAG TPA: efflux RND transporter periplasmic adaptor subunit [Ramlibacter sp.]|nr:efflux RND transporter periplasmic adaptor subunit [Ramlibacter sp.]